MDKIIGLGNALVDVLVPISDDRMLSELQLPKGSVTYVDESKHQAINELLSQMETHKVTGGSAGNAIRAVAELGGKAGFIGKVGKDDFGAFYRESLMKRGIVTCLLTSSTQPSGVAVTFITPDGERTFADHLGASAAMTAEELTADMFNGYTYLFIEGYLVQDHDMILHAIKSAKAEGLKICMDLSSYNIIKEEHDFFSMMVNNYVDIVFANEEETRAFTGQEPAKAARTMATMCDIAVVKTGAAGSIICKGEEEIRIAALPVKQIIDTTGAGDFYAAGFLYGLMNGHSLNKCGEIGSLLSAEVIQIIGTDLPDERWHTIREEVKHIIG